MKLEPLFARVLLERERPEKLGSIIIPGDAQRRNAPARGRVIAKGPNADKSIEVGSTYIFGQHAGAWINARGMAVPNPDDAELYVTADEDIIAKVIE